MENYSFGLAVLTLLVTFHSGLSETTKLVLTNGDIFRFQCNVTDANAMDLFSSPMKYSYIDPNSGQKTEISTNSVSQLKQWQTNILEYSTSRFFPFEMSGTVTLANSGTYTCSRSGVIRTIELTVKELTEDVKNIYFAIAPMNGDVPDMGESMIVSRMAGDDAPAPKEVNVDSGFYLANCSAIGGIPPPLYKLRAGDSDLALSGSKVVLINSASTDLSCHIETGEFMHVLQFNLRINPGHPDITCSSAATNIGATDAEFDCLVSGKDLDCAHFSWISEIDQTSFATKANYTVVCEVDDAQRNMKQILKIGDVKQLDFDDGFILKFENHLAETFQKVNKLMVKEEQKDPSSATNVVPMGMVSLVLLSALSLVL